MMTMSPAQPQPQNASASGYMFLLGSLVIFTGLYFLLIRKPADTGVIGLLRQNEVGARASAVEQSVAEPLRMSAVADAGASQRDFSGFAAPTGPAGGGEKQDASDVKTEAISFGEVVKNKDGSKSVKVDTAPAATGEDKVVKQRSDIDGEYYFVAASLPEKVKAANKLAEIHRRSQYLLQAIDEQLDGNRRITASDGTDITDNMRKLVKRHYQKSIPFAEYHNPDDQTVGSNSDKGMLIQICLRSKADPTKWNSDNTLFRVHVHELAHSADHHFREDGNAGHGPEFYRLMNHLLGVAENLGIYSCAEYKRSGRAFCGLALTEEDTHCG